MSRYLLWHGYRVKGARKNWDEWLELVEVTDLLPLKTAASTIKEKLWGILNAMRFGVSNALAEAINGKIRQLRIRAMGFRNKERFKTAIMFHYGNLKLTH
ncbi:MAG: transposase [Aestuariibacter sp.]